MLTSVLYHGRNQTPSLLRIRVVPYLFKRIDYSTVFRTGGISVYYGNHTRQTREERGEGFHFSCLSCRVHLRFMECFHVTRSRKFVLMIVKRK
jgi:hypothetical protein